MAAVESAYQLCKFANGSKGLKLGLCEMTGDDSGEAQYPKISPPPTALIGDFGIELRSQANRLLNIADAFEGVCHSYSGGRSMPVRRSQHDMLDVYALAKKAYKQRRARDGLIDADLLGETAWDILLDLTVAEGESRLLSVTAVCQGSGSQPTTALRWIAILEERGLLFREPDPNDKRRSWVKITAIGLTAMTNYFNKAAHLF